MTKIYKVLANSITVTGENEGKVYRQDSEVTADKFNISDLEQYVLNGSVECVEGIDEIINSHTAEVQKGADALSDELQIEAYQQLSEELRALDNVTDVTYEPSDVLIDENEVIQKQEPVQTHINDEIIPE